jgi:hypothetical protein
VRLSFAGSATRAEIYLRQLLLLKPGVQYRLEFFARSDRFVSPGGPLVTINNASGLMIAESNYVASGSSDWQLYSIDFKPPAAGAPGEASQGSDVPVYVSIQSGPKAAGPGESRGTVQFDDFVLRELPAR